MRLQKGQRWECESRYCGCEIQVLASSEVGGRDESAVLLREHDEEGVRRAAGEGCS